MTEVRAIKRSISERHGNDIDLLLHALISQEQSERIVKAKQPGTALPATLPVFESKVLMAHSTPSSVSIRSTGLAQSVQSPATRLP